MEFQTFIRDLKEQIKISGNEIEFDEGEARELFALTRGELDDEDVVGTENNFEDGGSKAVDEEDNVTPPDFETFFTEIKDEWGISETEAREMYDSFDSSEGEMNESPATNHEMSSAVNVVPPMPVREVEQPMVSYGTSSLEVTPTNQAGMLTREAGTSINLVESQPDAKLAAIQEALPGFPESRAKKVLRTFEKSLNYPSMLELVPILRENMPDHLTAGWLKRRNIRNAEVALQQAETEGVVDIYVMNGALQVKTSTGSLDGALTCHEDEFKKNGLVRYELIAA